MAIFWRVLMRKLKDEGHELICLTPPGDENSEKLLESYGARIINYPLSRKGLNPLQDMKSFFALKKIFLAEKPDLLFATTIKAVIYGLLAAGQAQVPARFATITGLGYAFERNSIFKKLINRLCSSLYKLSLAKASGIFFQNKDDRDLFLKDGIIASTDPLRMARGTGVDTKRFSPLPLPAAEKGALNFLFVGRLLEAKGLFDYVKAAGILARRWPRARFQILGPMEEGPGAISRAQLNAWLEEGNIQYLGSSDDVRPFIGAAHVVVLPSWREGVPTSLMEAMSMGRPCVATDAPGCREVVRDAWNGFLCKVQDAEDLAACMNKFLEEPDLVSSMGKNGREMALSNFDADKVALGIINDMKDLSPATLWQEKES